jgi:hypothetical protein
MLVDCYSLKLRASTEARIYLLPPDSFRSRMCGAADAVILIFRADRFEYPEDKTTLYHVVRCEFKFALVHLP